uniref:Uncharacterized protein n=1 Tax=Sinocyclocheilus rhinocerous TaxID=307959 RepID=A0A673KX88_9TELE
ESGAESKCLVTLYKLECHFTWDLGQYRNELQGLRRNMQEVEQQACIRLIHHYNLLGYIQQSLGFNTEALKYLHKAESVMQEQGTEEAGVRLQVNKANLAWVYFLMGEMDKSKGYLEEVERLQRMHPAPPGCALHPEVSGEKGWTLVKFNKSKKRQAIDYFKEAEEAEPERKEWHKGLAIAMSRASEFRTKQFVQREDNERQMQDLLEKTLETGDLECLGTIFRYFGTISVDKAIEAAERAREKFPTSNRVLKYLANCYKWKVFNMKEDKMERKTLAMKSTKLFEEVVRHYPDSLREKVALASMHKYAGNSEKANKIYKQLLSEIDDFPPHSQQYIYYSYACYLYNCRRLEDSINFHMKVAEIPGDSDDKQKSIKILKKTGMNGKNPRSYGIRIERE